MNLFQIERRPDAQRTILRVIVCFVPILSFIYFTIGTRSREWTLANSQDFSQLIEFEQAVVGAVALAGTCLGVLLFTSWQTYARNPLFDEAGLAWLSLHGWEGETSKLPQRGLLPVSELIGIMIVSLLGAQLASSALVMIPLCWSVARSSPYWPWINQTRPWAWGTLLILHATAIWASANWWISLPIEVAAIVLAETLSIDALRRSAAALWTRDVTMSRKASKSHHDQSPRGSQAPTPLPVRLFPFSQLGVIPNFERPTWTRSTWIAVVVAWALFCLTDATVRFDKITNPQGTEFSVPFIIGMFGLGAIAIIDFLQTLRRFAPYAWQSRIGLYERLRTRRPIIWSWDRVLVPHLITVTLLSIAATYGASIPPVGFAALAFAFVLILQQGGPTAEHWQMTADAKLNISFLANLHYTNTREPESSVMI